MELEPTILISSVTCSPDWASQELTIFYPHTNEWLILPKVNFFWESSVISKRIILKYVRDNFEDSQKFGRRIWEWLESPRRKRKLILCLSASLRSEIKIKRFLDGFTRITYQVLPQTYPNYYENWFSQRRKLNNFTFPPL